MIIFEVNEDGWIERREFSTVADLIDYLVLQDGPREKIAARFLRGVETEDEVGGDERDEVRAYLPPGTEWALSGKPRHGGH